MPIYKRDGRFRVVVFAHGSQHERRCRGPRSVAEALERRMRDELGLPDLDVVEDTTAESDTDEVIWIRGGIGTYVYFIQAGTTGPIKIGWTKHAKVRLKYMQTGNAEPLRLLCAVPGGRMLEHTIHRAFAKHRIEGEWFTPNKLLLKLIDELSLANVRNHGSDHGQIGKAQ